MFSSISDTNTMATRASSCQRGRPTVVLIDAGADKARRFFSQHTSHQQPPLSSSAAKNAIRNPAQTNLRVWYGSSHPHKWTLLALGLASFAGYVYSVRQETKRLEQQEDAPAAAATATTAASSTS